MKIYVIKNADGSEQPYMTSVHKTRQSAGMELMRFINDHNDGLLPQDSDSYLTPLDFMVEEVEVPNVNTNFSFRTACMYLSLKPNMDLSVIQKKEGEHALNLGEVTRLVQELNPSNIRALIALNELLTIAQAWNKEDGFGVDDLKNPSVRKYFPIFSYDNDKGYFDLKTTDYTYKLAYSGFGFNLCFKSRLKAEQFGMQFSHLFNEVLSFNSMQDGTQI